MLEDVHVGPNPLLDKNCKERCRQTAYETGDQVNVHSDVRKRRSERRIWRWGVEWDGNLWGDGRNLL
jgi:hypothetical protein